MTHLARAVPLCAFLCVSGAYAASLNAQAKAGAQSRKAGAEKPAPTKTPSKLGRRYTTMRGAWSAATVSLFNTWSGLDFNPGRRMSFYSPDQKKMIKVVGANVTLFMDGKSFKTDINNHTKHDAELAWSPDSTKFFVTWTDGGELGTWNMQVYGVDKSGVHQYPNVEVPALKDFEQRVRQWPIDPILDTPKLKHVWDEQDYCEFDNVVGGRWMNESKDILLSVLVPDTSDCRYMGAFDVYVVNAVTGKILQRFTAAEGHKRFGDKYLPKIIR